MQPMHYEYMAIVPMGVLSVALVEFLARLLHHWLLSATSPAVERWRLIARSVAFVGVLTSLTFASASYAVSSDTTATAATDQALYAYLTQRPLHRGYMYCLVAIEYSGDYQGRFCPGSRLLIRWAQKALNQTVLDLKDDAELRRILLFIAKSAKDGRDAQPEQGAQIRVAPRSLDQISRLYQKEPAEQPFLYCYADILYFAESDSAYCRYTIAKLNLRLFEESEPLLADRDPVLLFSILKSIVAKEKL
ncbi:hypothetical protein ELI13_37310 [Rhizobium ruizarguesonis]|uniref:Uncharacterized protein n=1 Tax=Rhizobium ruizarguesonis TaxID=2081791 RepID=A0ABY1WXC8_9HYPH|nr:hypothetical protein [Rhizobium ruizarguesonis]TAU14424.1 hypothetical protein ELI48_35100 [Rhizobium ruizarguesonis]TAU56958.1 hypothetical protein ELI45_38535 [Rhizobium ruizarguesonis]TAU60892.1 hypothetical protein ELI46_34410 [Rhizobium ruizarguesonis]TAV08996.1 hypothetical protein ELI34_27100 [Rhizobium ruizarguesonis]TAV20933.1 hypothetical protein ELI36_33165 [Rhizobium ruizarguesonis]